MKRRYFDTRSAVQITGVSRARIDQMISKGLILLRKPPKIGRPRQMMMNELAEIMVIDRLTIMGLDMAGHGLIHHMPLRLIYRAPEPVLVIERLHIGAENKGKSLSPRFQAIQNMRFTTMEDARLSLGDPDLIGTIILPLQEILDHVEAAAEELGIF